MLNNTVRQAFTAFYVIAGLYLAIQYNAYFGRLVLYPLVIHPLLGRIDRDWIDIAGAIGIFAIVTGTGELLITTFRKDWEGDTSTPTRWTVGYGYRYIVAAIYITFVVIVILIARNYLATHPRLLTVSRDITGDELNGQLMLIAIFFLIFARKIQNWIKHAISNFFAPLRNFERTTKFGQGGSSRMGTLLDEWRLGFRKGAIWLGNSVYDPPFRVGLTDKSHLVTIAGSRAGKGRSAIIPNLITWPHSALVIDPKGINAIVTAAARGKGGYRTTRGLLHQNVYLINPFRVLENHSWMKKTSHFNPLSMVDLDASTIFEDLDMIADALVIPTSEDSFFDRQARTLIRAAVGHAVTMNSAATLFDVYEMLSTMGQENDETLDQMLVNHRAGGVIKNAAAAIAEANPKLRSDIIVTAIGHINWVASPAMQEALGTSDFSLTELKLQPTTVYVILPPEYLETHARFMRLFVNLTIKAASIEGRSKTPILFILDEVYSLGTLSLLTKAIGNLAGYNVKIWPIVQNLSQLIANYPKNWETFFANSAHVQVFGISDKVTADYVSYRLGQKVIYETVEKEVTPKATSREKNSKPAKRIKIRQACGFAKMFDATELERATSNSSGKQIILRTGADPLYLYKPNYDKHFSASRYNPDPDIEKSFFRKLFKLK